MAAFAHPENPAGLVERSRIGSNLYGDHGHIVNRHSGRASANETDLRSDQPSRSKNGINRLVRLGKADGATSTIFNAKQNRAPSRVLAMPQMRSASSLGRGALILNSTALD